MAKTPEQKAADKAAKEAAAATAEAERRAALTQEERDAEDAAAAAKSGKTKPTEVTVKFRDHEGKPTERTFSKEVHGEKFAELAEEFKNNPDNARRIVS